MASNESDIYNSKSYMEGLIRHLYRSSRVLEAAKKVNLNAKHFSIGENFTSRAYEILVGIVLDFKHSPPYESSTVLNHINIKIQSDELPASLIDQTLVLLRDIYNPPLEEEYYISTIRNFVNTRRCSQLLFQYMDNPVQLAEELAKAKEEFSERRELLQTKAKTVRPFAKLIKKEVHSLVPTGFSKIDSVVGGLGYGEYGIVLGYSGGGKTALGVNLCGNVADMGLKSTFMSLEEETPNASNRFYSRYFKISYTGLHNGSAYMELEREFNTRTQEARMKRMTDNLVIEGLKEVAPMTPKDLYQILLKSYEELGHQPDMVVVDQLQFLIPSFTTKSDSPWQREKQAAKECDELSHMRIGNKPFALWVLHQAKGKLRKYFTTDEIDGFKGIVHTADMVLGIGREKVTSNDFAIFSLKSRHAKNFEVSYNGNLEHMDFVDLEATPLAKEGFQINKDNPIGAGKIEMEVA